MPTYRILGLMLFMLVALTGCPTIVTDCGAAASGEGGGGGAASGSGSPTEPTQVSGGAGAPGVGAGSSHCKSTLDQRVKGE